MRKMTVWMAILAIVASLALAGCKKGGSGAADAAKGPEEVKAMMAKGGTGAAKAAGAKAGAEGTKGATEGKAPAAAGSK